jgi:N-acetylglucosamine-6-phosphate deacetylase
MSLQPDPASRAPHAVMADRVFDGRRWHDHAAVLIEDGRIRGIAKAADVPLDMQVQKLPAGSILAPGFIDLQVNGGGRVLLNDSPTADAMRAIARAHRQYGTTACLPTLITDTRGQMRRAIEAGQQAAGAQGVLGLHLEGPFLSPQRPGVHRPDLIATANEEDREWLSGLDRTGHWLVTLAPECVPTGWVKSLTDAGIRVSAGHSEASAKVMSRAMDEGLTGVTHLFNAMPAMTAREPGIVGTALADARLIAGLIVDGIHVDPLSVKAAFSAKGADGIALVTDAMPTVGATAKTFELMGRTITLDQGRLQTADGTLAGAHLDMAAAVRNAVKLAGIPLEDALRAASLTPAKFLGLENERGALTPGARADLVALTSELEVTNTWIGGVSV